MKSTIKTGGSTWEVTATKTAEGVQVSAVGKWRGEASNFSVEFLHAEPQSPAYLARLEGSYLRGEVQGFGFKGLDYFSNSILGALTASVWRNMDTGEIHGWSVYSRHYSDGWTDAKRKSLYAMIETGLNSLDLLNAETMKETEKALQRANAEMILREVERLRESANINLETANIKEAQALEILAKVGN